MNQALYAHMNIKRKMKKKKRERSFHIDKGNNLEGEDNNSKHIDTEYQCTQFHKAMLLDIKTQTPQPNNSC
jgi:hypothetical protein